jgi:hypothetical protein
VESRVEMETFSSGILSGRAARSPSFMGQGQLRSRVLIVARYANTEHPSP